MNVRELIKILETYPLDIPVVYSCFSEQLMIEEKDIEIKELCMAREDGWVANKRPDKASMHYLVLPGN